MIDPVTLKRINDYTFLYKKDELEVKILLKDKSLSVETCSNIAKKVVEIYEEKSQEFSQHKTQQFRFGKKNWKVQTSRVSRFIKFIRSIFPFFHLPADNSVALKVNKAWFRKKKSKKDKEAKKASHQDHLKWKKATKDQYARANFKRRIDPTVSETDYKLGTRAQIKSDGAEWEKCEDPFTKLAGIAFQNYETDFASRDDSTPETSDYRIIYHGEHFKLVRKDANYIEELHKKALKKYLKYIRNTFGEDKIETIAHRYRLNLNESKQLSPEYIYRINIGLAKVYATDMNPKFSVDAIKNSLTQREVYGKIQGAYTIAEGKIHKPWIDDQELLQTFEQLIAAKNWTSYMEIASHIISKKHLAEKLKDESYKVGMLIPAPSFVQQQDEETQYFIVNRCITNGFIHGYIFEGHGKNSKLPILLLDRSTASSPYALCSERTIMNDFNHFYSPGHMGIHLMEDKVADYLKERTIPVWVGYYELAKQSKDDTVKSIEFLKQSLLVLEEEEQRKNRKLNFREVLQKHDMLLEQLYLISEKLYLPDRRSKEVAKFSRLLTKFINKYINIHFEDYQVNEDQERADAEQLLELLQATPSILEINSEWFNEAINDLCDHIIDPQSSKEPIEAVENEASALDELRDELKDLDDADSEKLESILQKFENIAIYRNESLNGKTGYNFLATGHSLGGACIQQKIVQFFVSHNRMPLPGKDLSVAIFDSPGVNREDNIKFKNWGKQHLQLFKEHNVSFKLTYSFEEGDPVPRAGEEFLGATFSNEETKDLKEWLDFEAHVYGRMETSTVLNIARSEYVHDTLFQEGVEGIDYRATKVTPEMLGLLYRRGIYSQGLTYKEAKQLYHEVYSEVFKFPSAFEGILNEEFRKGVGLIGRKFRGMVFKNRSLHTIPNTVNILDITV